METVLVIFLGDEFYLRSGNIMSSLYLTDGTRYDWGRVSLDLQAGKNVFIRPATDAELVVAYRKLKIIRGE